MRKSCIAIGLTLGLFLSLNITGCSSPSNGSVFQANGIPHERFKVGAALDIEYIPNEAGIAYLVDQNSNKILVIKSLEPGEKFGSNSAKVANYYDMALYFVPESSLFVDK